MTVDSKGRDLFIVDNSVSGWTGLRYLEEWSGIAKAFDIATGYFEIGALLALEGKWQSLEKIRILMGSETTHRTRKALLESVKRRALQVLDGSFEADKSANPFLQGVAAILKALRTHRSTPTTATFSRPSSWRLSAGESGESGPRPPVDWRAGWDTRERVPSSKRPSGRS